MQWAEPDRALQQRRARSLALLTALLLAAHVGLLGGVASRWRGPVDSPAVAAMDVRMVLPMLPAAAPLADLPAAAAAAPALARAEPAPRATRAERAAQPEPEPAPAAATAEPASAEAADPAPAPVPAEPPPLPMQAREERQALAPEEALPEPGAYVPSPPAALAAGSDAAESGMPALPPAVTLGYELRRGLLRGSAELRWAPHDRVYELNFDARVAGFSLLRQVSTGDIGEGGLAPGRFTDQRAGRDVRATNFQREAGKITFSGPGVELPLIPGAQDRLSWMVQLAAVVAGDPRRAEAGGEVVMAVVGTRADMAGWVFRSLGPETVETALGPVTAAKFVRQRRDAFDTEVEVWLDPARHHMPVRAAIHNTDDTLELLLRQAP